MTQIEQIKTEIERRIKYLDMYKDITETSASARQELVYLQSIIESLKKEHPIDGLDEAADCYKDTIKPEDVEDSENFVFYETYTEEQIADAFKAGAEWMARQYKTLGETEIYLEDDGDEAPYTQEWLDLATTEFAIPEGFKPGDKVIVQIRKAE